MVATLALESLVACIHFVLAYIRVWMYVHACVFVCASVRVMSSVRVTNQVAGGGLSVTHLVVRGAHMLEQPMCVHRRVSVFSTQFVLCA